MARTIKRCCFKWSVATGVQIIGYYNLVEILLIIVLYTVIERYEYISMILCPFICFMVFMRLQRVDGVRPRKKFLWTYVGMMTIVDALQVS